MPGDLKAGDVALNGLWARRHGTQYNGAPYIVQRAGEAVYSKAGKQQIREMVGRYMNCLLYTSLRPDVLKMNPLTGKSTSTGCARSGGA